MATAVGWGRTARAPGSNPKELQDVYSIMQRRFITITTSPELGWVWAEHMYGQIAVRINTRVSILPNCSEYFILCRRKTVAKASYLTDFLKCNLKQLTYTDQLQGRCVLGQASYTVAFRVARLTRRYDGVEAVTVSFRIFSIMWRRKGCGKHEFRNFTGLR